MRKRAAIFLFGTLLLSTGGYVAWCWRSFYVKPSLVFDSSVSPEGRKAMEEWRNTSSYPKALEFKWSAAWWNLGHPYDCEKTLPVRVEENANAGLWARHMVFGSWVFSKIAGEWDASTVVKIRGMEMFQQARLAAQMEAWSAAGATIEILSLGRPAGKGHRELGVPETQGASADAAEMYHGYPVLGRIKALEARERLVLLDDFTRSIREAAMPDAFLPEIPRHGIVFIEGEKKHEFAISFESGYVYAFEPGIEGSGVAHGRSGSYFQITPRASSVFAGFLKKSGIEQGGLDKK
ncbi:hypothetical protein [Luteolibacter soli]|uniref:Uncharacterized protein n=1 Tax=Luteolibacter soli TaxID=3135280 RepID=A0ABU9AVU4_9BACT